MEKNKMQKILFMDALEEGNRLLFLNHDSRYFLFLNLDDMTLKYAGYIESNWMNAPMRRIFRYKGMLYMVSFAGLIIYGCEENKGYYKGNVIYHDDLLTHMRIIDAFLIENSIFVIPYSVEQDIICYNIEKNTCKIHTNISRQINVEANNKLSDIHCIDGCIYFSISGENNIYMFHKDTDRISVFVETAYPVSGFAVDGENIWIRYTNGYALIKTRRAPQNISVQDEKMVDGMFLDNKGWITVLNRSNMIFIPGTSDIIGLLTSSNKMKYLDTNGKVRLNDDYQNSRFSFGGTKIGNKYFLYPWRCKDLVCIDLDDMSLQVIELKYMGNIDEEYMEGKMKREDIIYEDTNHTLNLFLNII